MTQLNWWKWLAVSALLGCGALLVALVVAASQVLRPVEQRMSDERLIGEWQSDADRTIAGIREARSVSETQEAKLRMMFGKLRVTYTATALTTVFDDSIESIEYKVLGRDKHSVVIQEIDPELSQVDPMDILKLTTFAIIHFDGPDSYWLRSKFVDEPEWFKRVKSPPAAKQPTTVDLPVK